MAETVVQKSPFLGYLSGENHRKQGYYRLVIIFAKIFKTFFIIFTEKVAQMTSFLGKKKS